MSFDIPFVQSNSDGESIAEGLLSGQRTIELMVLPRIIYY